MPDRIPVLVAASGAPWETEALDRLNHGGPGLVLHKRCVDLPDLLATAATGLAGVAVVSGSLPGLDADSIGCLARAGVGVVLVTGAGELGTEAHRLRRLGAEHLVDAAELGGLAGLVVAAATSATSGAAPVGRTGAPPVPTGPGAPRAGRLTVVWGPAGAPGRTTVAVGLAAELAARRLAAMLVDADPYAGAVAQHLGVLDEASGLLGAARLANAGRLDAPRLASLARQVGALRVLSGLPRADRWAEVRPAAFDDLLELATTLAGHVVVDVGFSLEREPADPFGAAGPGRNQMTVAAVERADEVVVVGAADPVGLARLARALVEVRELVPDTPLRVVVNRWRPSLGWGVKEIHGMVEGFVTPVGMHVLPDDRRAVDRALMAGSSLVESGDSELRGALAELADAVAGEPSGTRPRRRRGLRRAQAPKSR